MFDFSEYIPTEIIFGNNAVCDNSSLIAPFGNRCFIVTGRTGAAKSGALSDFTEVLEKLGIEYGIFSEITENPALSECIAAARSAIAFKTEFVIGIGGGSAIDAAKAVAVLLKNPSLIDTPELLLSAGTVLDTALPLIAVPTTSGTGSEANRYSVITLDNAMQKKSFKTDAVIPKIAFIDPKYTASIPQKYAIASALDAFCHCVESYMSPKATEKSEKMALLGAELILPQLKAKKIDSSNEKIRADLAIAALAGGIAINTTGTAFPHPFGYNLTTDFGVPHGNACACFYGQYIKYCMANEQGKEKIFKFCSSIGSTPNEIAELLPELSRVNLSLPASTIEKFLERVSSSQSHENCLYKLTEADKKAVFNDIFLK